MCGDLKEFIFREGHCIVMALLVPSHRAYTDLRERKSEGSGERSQKSRGRTGEQVGRRAGFASNVLLHSLPASFSSSVTN